MKPEHRKVERRTLEFAQRPSTKIWQDVPSEANPYIAKSCRCHGYDLLELLENCSFIEIQYLLFRGELPSPQQTELLEKLMIAMINPGPRHPAARAAMCAGVGKTDVANMLPLALNVMGGYHQGAAEVKACLSFLHESVENNPATLATQLLAYCETNDGDKSPAPGFGNRFGSIDVIANEIAKRLAGLPGAGRYLAWGEAFAQAIQPEGMGWYRTGVAASVLADLGFQPLEVVGFYQYLCAPGILAHGLEMQEKPLTAMPFPTDDKYFIEE